MASRWREEYRRPAHGVMCERGERFVGLLEGEELDVRSHRQSSGFEEKIFAVLTRVVCDRADATLTVDRRIREGRDIAHMDAAQDERRAFIEMGERGRNDLACGRKHDGRIEPHRRLFEGVANPRGAELVGQGLVLVAIARAHEDLRPAPACDLNRDVSSCPKAVDAKARASKIVKACLAQAAKPDDSSAEQGCGLEIAKAIGQFIDEVGRRDDVFRKASVDGPAREVR